VHRSLRYDFERMRMPALAPTEITAKIEWPGYVSDRAATLKSTAVDHVMARFSGVDGEHHAGLTRLSCSRVTAQYRKGTDIRNVRQFSILSAEELEAIAAKMGLDRLDPALVGASMIVRGIPDFTHVPPSSRLQSQSGATLVVDMANRPCHLPADPINQDSPGYGRSFKAAAKGRRGVTAWVECEGKLQVDDTVRLHVPDQRPWHQLTSGLSG